MLAIILYTLASVATLWAVAGLFNPRVLFFAQIQSQTRTNAFFFPLRLAIPFAIIGRMENAIMNDISYSWGASLGVCLAFLWYAAKRAAVLRGGIHF
ncbi:MAG: hypothetical protein FWG59_07615 [Betaproteobacteria bacterium]|nr:hypothetical protein [Betaproteobacteria bacterium]